MAKSEDKNDKIFSNLPERLLPPKKYFPDLIYPEDFSRIVWNREHLNCAEILIDGIKKRGLESKIAYYTDKGPIKYREIIKNTGKLANGLKGLGIESGDRVVIRFGERIEGIIAQLAVWMVGGVAVPTVPLERSRELEYIFNDTECRFVIAQSDGIEEVQKALDNSPTVENVIVAGDHSINDDKFIQYDDLIKNESSKIEPEKTKPLDANIILYTGGTTGRPKGCIHPHATEIYFAKVLTEHRGTRLGDVHFFPGPLGHAFGNGEKITQTIYGGITSVLFDKKFSPELALEIIEKFRVSIFIGSPTMLRMMLRANPEKYDLTSLRLVEISGEYFDETTFREWTKILGFEPWNTVGMTPFRHLFILSAKNGRKIAPGLSVGQPAPGFEIKVVDEKGEELPPEKEGYILVRGPSGICYLNNKHPDIKRYLERDMNWGGWSLSDDIYIRDQEGWLWFKSRESFLIRSGGRFISPTEVEEILNMHPAVVESAVVPSPDKERGEVVKAFIVLSEGYKPSGELVKELQEFVKSKIAPYKYPRKIEFVDSLPKDGVGKIQRRQLKEKEFAKSEQN